MMGALDSCIGHIRNGHPDIAEEAAAELAQLRAVNKKLRDAVTRSMQIGSDEILKLRAELDEANYYWMKYLDPITRMCTLCGQSGIIHTEGIRTPAGLEVGRANYCICPNGQTMRRNAKEGDK